MSPLTLLASEEVFPPLGHILEWKEILFKDTPFALNKIGLTSIAAAGLTILFFLLAGRKTKLVPSGAQNLAEIVVDGINENVVKAAMTHGQKYLPLLTSMFMYIFFCNIAGIIWLWQMPATARMAVPLFMALVSWAIFIVVGVKNQGIKYFTHLIWPPGVPTGVKPLLGLIEFISTLFIRPFSLAVRLFANMLAGHILLVTFASLAMALVRADSPILKPVSILPAAMLIIMTFFEILVALLQAYIFTMLTAVYIESSEHAEH